MELVATVRRARVEAGDQWENADVQRTASSASRPLNAMLTAPSGMGEAKNVNGGVPSWWAWSAPTRMSVAFVVTGVEPLR